MAETDHDQKTEQPTEKRLETAMDQGEFAKPPEITIWLMLAALLGVFALTVPAAARTLAEYSIGVFTRFATTTVTRETATVQLGEALVVSGKILGPVFLACAGAAVVAGGLLSGFRLSPEAVGFKPENLSWEKGFDRVFDKSAIIRAGIDLLKLTAIGGVLYIGTSGLLEDSLFSVPVEAAYLAEFMNRATLLFLSRLLLALGIVAAISYGYEKFKTSRGMMMTREEVKHERKSADGSSHSKAAMRRLARRLMQKQMLSAVPTADVIVTNPTHYAVALKYERGCDRAPVVLAKGENRFAMHIKALGAQHGVPMVENRPLARMLFALGKVGEAIPAELYQATAEILAVVYRTHRYYFHRLKTRRLEVAS
ncbi:MAG: EscU/YscU/HrcU family type III secretion system export apparatus switch protein [Verrucomicrobiota bacterium]|jgi:flagellar biosynthetic protein FlhB